jgi:maltose/moltooligosaccharide transporter
MEKRKLSFQIWNMSFGFLGIQMVLPQNSNVRIFQTLGANIDDIPIYGCRPMTGLIIQPIIGYFSDRLGQS